MRRRREMGFARVLAVVGAVGACLATTDVRAVPCDAGGPYPCSFNIEAIDVVPASDLLKLQARLSQSKEPLSDGVLGRVIANLRKGDQTVCTEEFRNVQVEFATINLELGRNASCKVAEVVARNADLNLQVCIGGPVNCLRPVALATVPYALKSTYAALAQQALKADSAAVANYALRAAADADLSISKNLSTGYFDFKTPASAPQLYSASEFAPYANGGFILWTPLQESSPTLHISARSLAADAPMPLDTLVLAANETETLGSVLVKSGGAAIAGNSLFRDATTVKGRLTLNAPAGGGQSGLDVAGPMAVTGGLSAGSLVTSGSVTTGGAVTVPAGGARINGDVTSTGPLTTTNRLTVSNGGATIGGPLTIVGATSVSGDVDLVGALTAGSIDASTVDADSLTVNGLTVNGTLRVTGAINFPATVSFTGVASDFNVPLQLTAGAITTSSITLSTDATYAASGTRPSSAATISGELTAAGPADSGFLRVSAGGATDGSKKSYIDLSGSSANAALHRSITMFTGGSERLKIQGSEVTITGNLVVNGSISSNGGSAGSATYYWIYSTAPDLVRCNVGDYLLNQSAPAFQDGWVVAEPMAICASGQCSSGGDPTGWRSGGGVFGKLFSSNGQLSLGASLRYLCVHYN